MDGSEAKDGRRAGRGYRAGVAIVAVLALTSVYTALVEVARAGLVPWALLGLLVAWPPVVLGWIRIAVPAEHLRVRAALALGVALVVVDAALDLWVPYETRYVLPWWLALELLPLPLELLLARRCLSREATRVVDDVTRFAAFASFVALLLQGGTVVWVIASETRDATRPADVAIVLGFGLDEAGRPRPPLVARVDHGVELYRRGIVRQLVVSGGARAGPTEASAMRLVALRGGVPDEAILVEPRARSTEENLVFSMAIMRRRRLRTALVVTEPYHMPRAMLLARRIGLDARASPSREGWPHLRDRSFWVVREARQVLLLLVR